MGVRTGVLDQKLVILAMGTSPLQTDVAARFTLDDGVSLMKVCLALRAQVFLGGGIDGTSARIADLDEAVLRSDGLASQPLLIGGIGCTL